LLFYDLKWSQNFVTSPVCRLGGVVQRFMFFKGQAVSYFRDIGISPNDGMANRQGSVSSFLYTIFFRS